MKIKRLLSWTLFLAGAVALCSGCIFPRSDSKILYKEMDDTSFDKISIGSFLKVRFVQADSCKLKVRISKKLEPYMTVKIEDGKLIAFIDRYHLSSGRMKMGNIAELEISAPYFEKLELIGASRLVLAGKWELDETDITVKGASELIGENISAESLSLRQAGASSIKATLDVEELILTNEGACKTILDNRNREAGKKLGIKVAGASKINLSKLRFENVKITATGASKIEIFPLKHFEADIYGASKVSYNASSPELHTAINRTGMSSVTAE